MDKHIGQKCISVVGDNLLYIVGVVFLSWAVFDIFVLFWIENLVLGFFGLQRLLLGRRPSFGRRIYAAMFYVLGLGVFSLIFGLFAWIEFSGLNVPGNREASLAAMKQVLTRPQFLVCAAVLTGFQAWDLVFGYLASRRFRWIDAEWEMRHVGIRMFILTLALLLGGGLLRQYGNPLPALILLVMLKTGIELGFVWNDRVLESARPGSLEGRGARRRTAIPTGES